MDKYDFLHQEDLITKVSMEIIKSKNKKNEGLSKNIYYQPNGNTTTSTKGNGNFSSSATIPIVLMGHTGSNSGSGSGSNSSRTATSSSTLPQMLNYILISKFITTTAKLKLQKTLQKLTTNSFIPRDIVYVADPSFDAAFQEEIKFRNYGLVLSSDSDMGDKICYLPSPKNVISFTLAFKILASKRTSSSDHKTEFLNNIFSNNDEDNNGEEDDNTIFNKDNKEENDDNEDYGAL